MTAEDGKMRATDVLNKEGITRIARRINTPGTEEFIEWLSQFGGSGKRYTLKHKDVYVLELELDDYGMIYSVIKILNEDHLPVGTGDRDGLDNNILRTWWDGRSIPASRDGLRELLEKLRMSSPQQLLDKSFGLSLSDQYWLCPLNETIRWKDVNFFHNPFSDDVGSLLIGKTGVEDGREIGLLSPDNTSDGILRKKWKIIGGKRYLIKAGTGPNNQEVANEVLASRICERLGIPAVKYDIIDIGGVKYSICGDFITDDTELVTARSVKNLIKKDNRTSDYDSFVAKAEELGIGDARRRIDMMLVLDFIIVNTDRHYNNFGLIRNADTLEWISVAPIYDSGTSMWCRSQYDMDAKSSEIESKPFEDRHIRQIELVKEFSWLIIDRLDGIEEEYEKILYDSVPDLPGATERITRLCSELRIRIELLRKLIGMRGNN